eukprot:318922_1
MLSKASKCIYYPYHLSFHHRYFSSNLPLSGIKVVDLSRVLAGPHCSQLLGDLGAEVIKIEHPEHGDETRSWGPPFTSKSKTSAYYLSCNRNKKSITINIKSNKGQKILHKLIAQSDILLENFIPDTLNKYNLNYEYLYENINKSLIHCSITGFGTYGPYKYKNGYDLVIQAMGGMMYVTGTKDEPCKTGVALIDIITGLYAQNAILAAIISRNASEDKLGQKIDLNLFDCCVSSLANIGSNYLIGNQEAQRWGTAHVNVVPYQGFKCLDEQFIIIGIGNDRQFAEFCGVLGVKYLLEDLRFTHNKDRINNRDVLIPILEGKLIEKTRDEWLNIFDGYSIPNAPINNMESVFNDKHLLERGLVKNVNHPIDGEIKIVGLPVEFSRDKEVNEIRMYPPMLGEHNKEIICDLLGFDESYLEQ